MRVITFKNEYEPKILAGTKTTTIRKERKDGHRHQVGDHVSLRVWTGRPYASKQREFAVARITAVEAIKITASYVDFLDLPRGDGAPDPALQTPGGLAEFSRADGFESWPALKEALLGPAHCTPFYGVRYSFELVEKKAVAA